MTTLDCGFENPALPAQLSEWSDQESHPHWVPREPTPESSTDCLITVDQAGEIIDFNPAAECIFACSRSQVVGQLLVDMVIPPAIRDRQWRVVFQNLLRGAGQVSGPAFEVIAARADGSEFPAEMSISRHQAQAPHIYTVSLRDITDRKRSELKTEVFIRGQNPHGLPC
jgi:PAS domain S-box-containing protein